MKWLVSCYEPFDNAETNSSQILCEQLQRRGMKDVRFVGPVPVRFADAWPYLKREIQDVDGVLALGQAEGRRKISLECIALNWIDARVPDNAGVQPRLVKVTDGPDVLWSQIPWANLGQNEMFERSYSAGTFLCNHLMFNVVDWARENGKMGGFVHIPVLACQAEQKFADVVKMEDADALKGLASILQFLTELKI